MRFTVTGRSGFTESLPETLRGTPITRLTNARFTGSSFPVAATRTMSLVEIMDPLVGPLMALLNNRTFDNTDFRYETTAVASGSLEQWEVVNLTGDAHPIHLHFTQFQVLNRQRIDPAAYQAAAYGPGMLMEDTGAYPAPAVDQFLRGASMPPAANERGWKDTVVALPGQVTRILAPFGPEAAEGAPLAIGAAHTGEYVWHCHILEHEDDEMMQRYVIA